MKKRIALIFAIGLIAASIAPAQAASMKTSIWAVVKNESVTIKMIDFPANHTFHVLMGYNGTQGINGYLVSKITTGEGGSFLAKFNIPEELANENIVAIRFECTTNIVDPPYNFFYNETATGTSNTTYTNTNETSYNNLPPGFPTFDILSVVKGASVTVQTRYFPAGQRFAVFMQDGASTAITLYEVAGIDTQEGNSFTVTLTIPDELQWQEKIKIIFYNINDGFRTYLPFNNRNQ